MAVLFYMEVNTVDKEVDKLKEQYEKKIAQLDEMRTRLKEMISSMEKLREEIENDQ